MACPLHPAEDMLKQCSRCSPDGNGGSSFCANCGAAMQPTGLSGSLASEMQRLRAAELCWAKYEADRAERQRRGKRELMEQAREYDAAALCLAGFAAFALGAMAASFYSAETILGACGLFCAFCFIVMAAACHGEADERRRFVSLLWPEQPEMLGQEWQRHGPALNMMAPRAPWRKRFPPEYV